MNERNKALDPTDWVSDTDIGHHKALDNIAACLSVTTLSYEEAVKSYLRDRGIGIDNKSGELRLPALSDKEPQDSGLADECEKYAASSICPGTGARLLNKAATALRSQQAGGGELLGEIKTALEQSNMRMERIQKLREQGLSQLPQVSAAIEHNYALLAKITSHMEKTDG